ncbi:aspartyl/asparaginyl beta-hydroxylase isoform 1 [Rattus norvegicus]|uniref:Aspartyl/asparaginyl beta-hydroxylase n=1 Tax=Rattus norvegicus TaxID=10116 RepID=A0A096MKE0_RAT|nr:aspartyl/asparaginyl beta-hydroxylase isoform 1 [Rattus norvegicus]|eukprot:XP_006237920.1 PREDICTED: aspartyl/asparaginyl beta-hydroxylase isoform X2 [Rattus norvegicus]
MAPRKNAKGGGGNSSSSGSGSGSGSPSTGSSGSSSSPGARREAKHGGHKNGRRGGISGGSFFTWFMVIALLGVWTSVAVVWFDLVDYEEVLGKLGVYDADGDGDFDVDDAKVLLGLKERSTSERTFPPEEAETQAELEEQAPEGAEAQNVEDEVKEQIQSLLQESVHTDHDLEADGPAGEPQSEVEDFLTATDSDDRFEALEPGTVHEDTEDSYHVEETASQNHPNDAEEVMSEQESSDHGEAVTDDGLQQHAEEVRHEDYDEPVYEPSENERIEISDNAIDDSNIISEEINVASVEEQQDTPPVKKKKPKLLNKFDKTIKAELDAAEKLRKRGKIEEAVSAFEELVRRYPQSPRARYGKAQCEDDLAEKQRSNEVLRRAIETYQEAASLPDAPTDLVKLSLKRRSERQQFLGHMRGSLLTLQRLVQLFPSDTTLKNDLGVGYLLMGDNDSAKKVYEEVLNVTPNDGFAKVHYGFILKAQNRIAESIPYLKEGIESGDPGTDDGRFYFHLGDAMQRVGNKEAYKWYELGHKRGHFASVWQRSLYNVNGLKAQPWWTPRETGYTELVKSLERNWKLIRDEGLMVMDKAKGLFLPEDENLREKGDWSQFTLWQQGRKNENACKGAPKTCTLLEKFSETTGCRRGQIKYSIMHPGTHVWPHTGPTNCRLRMHLGLVIPKEGCKIRCANETRSWEEGKVLIFDDSFEHEVWQDASSFRLIFIVDVWHPELTPQQRRSLPAI